MDRLMTYFIEHQLKLKCHMQKKNKVLLQFYSFQAHLFFLARSDLGYYRCRMESENGMVNNSIFGISSILEHTHPHMRISEYIAHKHIPHIVLPKSAHLLLLAQFPA